MGNRRISELVELTAPTDHDLIAVVDVSDVAEAASGATKRATIAALREAAAVEISDDFTALSENWEFPLGAVAVQSGMLRATALDPVPHKPLWDGVVGGFDRWALEHGVTHATIAVIEDEGPSGATVPALELAVVDGSVPDDPRNKAAYRTFGEVYINSATWTAWGWIRKVTEDAYPVRFGLGAKSGLDFIENYGDPVLTTEWTYSRVDFLYPRNWSTNPYYPRGWLNLPDDATLGVKARICDVSLRLGMAAALRNDWHRNDVQIEAQIYTPVDGPMLCGFVLRYIDSDNFIYLLLDKDNPTRDGRVYVVQVVNGTPIWSPEDTSINWTMGGYDDIRVRLSGSSLRFDYKLSGEDDWTSHTVVGLTPTESTRHGLVLLRQNEPAFTSVKFTELPMSAESDNSVFQLGVFLPGELTASFTGAYELPFDVVLKAISSVQQNAGDARMKVGYHGDNDQYSSYVFMGKSGVPVVIDAYDEFRFEHFWSIKKGTIFEFYIDHDGVGGTAGANISIVFTFQRLL